MNTVWYDYKKAQVSNGAAIAIGNFDGLHKGHAEIMNTLKKVSSENNLLSICYTFSHHPINVIKGENSLPLIASNHHKEILLDQIGIDTLFFEDFCKVKDLPAEDFVRDILLGELNMKVIVVGLHNHYGKNGEGDVKLLRHLGQKYGFLVYMVEPLYLDSVMCSSTKIREYIRSGEIEKANEMLGRPFTISNVIIKDKELGKKIGFPTANMMPESNMLMPKSGVYATSTIVDGKIFKSITNVGDCPTVGDEKIKFETHILDFEGNLYDKEIEVLFLHKMRDIVSFSDINSLKEQLSVDVRARREMNGKR